MTSHFSTIGLPVASNDDFISLANRVAEEAQWFETPQGGYLQWSVPCGAEIWLQVNKLQELIGMNPHFVGQSKVRVRLTASVDRSAASELDGAFHGWANPVDDQEMQGDYPFVFDLPNFFQHQPLSLPQTVEVQIAAFAHEVSLFDSLEDYDAAQTGELKFASQSFIPSGLFTSAEDQSSPPAYACFTGNILATQRHINPLSHEPFYWALVDSLGGTFDVVIDPELITQPPKVGGILQGAFWLSGLITSL